MYGLIELMFYWRLKDILGSLGYIIEVFGCKPYFSNKISDLWPLVAIDAESREAPLFPKHVHAALWGTLTLELFPLAFFPDAGVSRWSGEGKWASPPLPHTHTHTGQTVCIHILISTQIRICRKSYTKVLHVGLAQTKWRSGDLVDINTPQARC